MVNRRAIRGNSSQRVGFNVWIAATSVEGSGHTENDRVAMQLSVISMRRF